MPVIDLSGVDEADTFTPLPSGDYPAKIIEVEEGQTKSLDVMWKIKFCVIDHELAGRHFYDNWVFSENPNARQRLKLITKRLGFDVEKPINLTAQSVMGKTVLITLLEGKYIDRDGNERPSNNVYFSGYDYYIPEETPTSTKAVKMDEESPLPF